MILERLFLDSSILFSTASFATDLDRLWKLAAEDQCVLLTSRYAIEKTRRNLYSVNELRDLDGKLKIVRVVPEADEALTCPIPLPRRHSAVLMAAIFSKADYLLTLDQQAFGEYLEKKVRGVRIRSARSYLNALRNNGETHEILSTGKEVNENL